MSSSKRVSKMTYLSPSILVHLLRHALLETIECLFESTQSLSHYWFVVEHYRNAWAMVRRLLLHCTRISGRQVLNYSLAILERTHWNKCENFFCSYIRTCYHLNSKTYCEVQNRRKVRLQHFEALVFLESSYRLRHVSLFVEGITGDRTSSSTNGSN